MEMETEQLELVQGDTDWVQLFNEKYQKVIELKGVRPGEVVELNGEQVAKYLRLDVYQDKHLGESAFELNGEYSLLTCTLVIMFAISANGDWVEYKSPEQTMVHSIMAYKVRIEHQYFSDLTKLWELISTSTKGVRISPQFLDNRSTFRFCIHTNSNKPWVSNVVLKGFTVGVSSAAASVTPATVLKLR